MLSQWYSRNMANIALSDAWYGVYVVDNEYSVHRHSKKVQFFFIYWTLGLMNGMITYWNFSSFLRTMIHLLFTPIGSSMTFFLVITLVQGKCVKKNMLDTTWFKVRKELTSQDQCRVLSSPTFFHYVI